MCCLNKRVIIGLALVALAILAVSPQLLGAVLPVLILAVCPLSMLLMTRGMNRRGEGDGSVGACSAPPASTSRPGDSQLAELQEEVTRLRAELSKRRREGSA